MSFAVDYLKQMHAFAAVHVLTRGITLDNYPGFEALLQRR
jgi:hypothetical protein